MNKPVLLEKCSIDDMANTAIYAITEGEIDPIAAHINICRFEAAIKKIKDNPTVRDITLRELATYGRKHDFGDVTLEEAEAGVKYDYSLCEDSVLSQLEAELFELNVKIKARQQFLKALPVSGVANPETGELIFPPSKSSKTIIKTTFRKW